MLNVLFYFDVPRTTEMILFAALFLVSQTWSNVEGFDNTTAVRLGELPHAVVLRTSHDSKSAGICTGSIIHDSWVLTAGHCVVDSRDKPYPPENIEVTAGAIDYMDKGPSAQVRKGIKLIIHPEFSQKQLAKFDLALLKVEPFILSDVVKLAKLSGKEWPQDGRMYNRKCTSAGWGMLEGRKRTSILHKQQTVAKHGLKACNCIHHGYIMKRVVCLVPENKVGVCFGDSGGALLCDGEVVGVSHQIMDKRGCSYFRSVEDVIRCESPDVYGIYMFTCPYLGWIGEHVPGVPKPPASCPAPPTSPLSHTTRFVVLGLSALLIFRSTSKL